MNCLLFVLFTLLTLSESFLSSDICDSEISLPGFSTFRLDRNRHGGGILIYAKSSLSPSIIPYTSSPIELLLLSIKLQHGSCTVATFYRPPSSTDTLTTLQNVLESLPHSVLLKLILDGDFNVDYTSPSPSLDQINSISDLFSLTQIVTYPTHYSLSGSPSIIDLVFVPSSSVSSSCSVLPPLSNSDHNSILFSLPLYSSTLPSPPTSSRCVWLYTTADFVLAIKFLSLIPWSSILSSSDVNSAWLAFQYTFLQIMHLTVPSKLVRAPSYPPWLNRSLKSCVK